MKQKVHKLINDVPYKLIGIVTDMSNHQLLWLLDNQLGLKFKSSEGIVLHKKDNETVNFPTYFCDYSRSLVYVLYANKSENKTLVKSNKSADYILKCSGEINQQILSDLMQNIKRQSNIATAFEIDIEQLKKSEKLLFD